MPFSRFSTVVPVMQIVCRLEPKSVFDVGCGNGRYGLFFRELLDQVKGNYHKLTWEARIDGCEAFSSYITPIHNFCYNKVYLQDFTQLLDDLENYDLIFMGDVIEHFNKELGVETLSKALKKCKYLLLVTPGFDFKQTEAFGNIREAHRSFWTKEEFEPNEYFWTDGDSIVVLLKGGL